MLRLLRELLQRRVKEYSRPSSLKTNDSLITALTSEQVTGQGINDVKIVKKAVVWPFQKASTISISPFDFSIVSCACSVCISS